LPKELNQLKYGASIVNIADNATIPGGLGSFKYDDEGVRGQRTPLVKDGIFVGYLTSRETAARLGLPRSGGAMRSETGADVPMIRGTNVSLEPGNAGKLDALIAGTRHGIYFDTNQSWSIDDRRHNFQFGTEIAWEIRRGKLHRVLRDASYSGLTQKFWNSCKAICSKEEHVVWGIPNCGKGQPCQGMKVGHGAQPALFHKVQVGVATKDAMAHGTGGGCSAQKASHSHHRSHHKTSARSRRSGVRYAQRK
jgi:TldD protein